jgi:hypothetical protein
LVGAVNLFTRHPFPLRIAAFPRQWCQGQKERQVTQMSTVEISDIEIGDTKAAFGTQNWSIPGCRNTNIDPAHLRFAQSDQHSVGDERAWWEAKKRLIPDPIAIALRLWWSGPGPADVGLPS